MLQKLKQRLKNQKGFTLIELLAVIVILGIIAAIAIPAIGSIIDNTRENAIKADAKLILNAAKLYEAEGHNIGATAVDEDELGPYIDDVTTFTGTGSVAYTVKEVGGNLTISGTGVKGDVKVKFEDDTMQTIDTAERVTGS
ncbi:prepilin-type N-terminal cleavage/methylation domain-containing protein [Bacillus marasmi]|uniref:prepilin-type N-terminal cleavage/methylation domain-containing protein n=1 Tax=Bacillus marasmi TaxID=1926279 RepID=UPI0011C87CF6|nr:prepilin-type N-terminal cleavage/methylation domain-containing protein [Bacillus marasmi]